MFLRLEAHRIMTVEVSIMKTLFPIVCWTILVLAASPATTAPLGTAFTYQGQLNQSGSPINGAAHLRFSLWDAAGSGQPPVGGSQIGASQLVANIPVTNGLFTVQLNGGGEFGPNAFNGNARWLQIEVCADPGCGTLTVLSPRQPLTGTPYALGPWQTSGSNLTFSNGNVGIGTAAPTFPLDVHGPLQIVSTGDQADVLWLATERSWVFRQAGTGAGTALKLESIGGGGNKNFLIQTDGAVGVGVGITVPNAKLDVRGDIALGPTGQLRAAAGEENLRIVRGIVAPDGGIVAGTGFTVAHPPNSGVYTITFTPSFAGTPSVTATVHRDEIEDPKIAMIQIPSSGSVQILTYRVGDAITVANPFHFIAVGPR